MHLPWLHGEGPGRHRALGVGMTAISFNSVLIIAGVAVLVPVVLGMFPRLPVPGAVLEVVAGILVGPSVLGWVRVDAPVQVLSDLGLGMLLFLAGLEIDVDALRGPLFRLAGAAFAVFAAGDDADVRDRGGADRRGHREDIADLGSLAARRWTALRGPVPGRGAPAPVPPRRSGDRARQGDHLIGGDRGYLPPQRSQASQRPIE